MGSVRELRLVLTVEDFDAALAFYRDALGMEEREAWTGEDGGRIAILDAGAATIEIVDEAQARAIDQIEVGRRVSGPVRLALEVGDSSATGALLAAAGAELLAGPVVTPWGDRNVRMLTPEDMQLTLFTVTGD
jgi:lactoylglutathione lyase